MTGAGAGDLHEVRVQLEALTVADQRALAEPNQLIA